MSRAREFADLAGSADAGGLTGKNILINGSMAVSQRGTSIAMAHDGNTGNYLIDRFSMALGGTHEQLDGTYAQVADHPLSANGKSLKWTTGTAESSYDADEYVYFAQVVEAQNLQHINNGNANALPLTLSFYVKSSVTGTFACNLYKEDSTARIINKTYAISSANTWEKKSITFPADTGGGGIDNNNGVGLFVTWHLAAGANAKGGGSNGAWKNYGGLSDWADGQATNAVATTASATWQITDCQLEVGEQATPFDHSESYGDELARCQRYFYRWLSTGLYTEAWIGGVVTASIARGTFYLPTVMRAGPAISNSGNFRLHEYAGSDYSNISAVSINRNNPLTPYMQCSLGSSPLTVGRLTGFSANNDDDAALDFSAEL